MIRPVTCVSFLLACASGLYLYQAKHRVRVLDAEIEQVVHQTEQVREQSRALHAQWTLLDRPERLQQLAGQFLALQPTTPAQFTSLADLDRRLPPVPPPAEDHPPAPEAGPVVASAPAPEPAQVPPPPVAVARGSVERGAARPAQPPAPHPQLAALRPLRNPQAEMHRVPPRSVSPVLAVALPRPTPFYPHAVRALAPPLPRYAAGYGGSMLGMRQAPAPAAPTAWINWDDAR